VYQGVPLGYWSILLDKIDKPFHSVLPNTMVYFVLKTQATPEATRIFYVIKQDDVPEDEQKDIIHLKCKSVRRINGIGNLLHYLEQNTSNALHVTEPYIMKKISWNQAIDIFGLDYDTSDDDTGSSAITQ
jgi:hypothetical protein